MTYVKVMGQPLATETPSELKQRATEIVNRALGRGDGATEEEWPEPEGRTVPPGKWFSCGGVFENVSTDDDFVIAWVGTADARKLELMCGVDLRDGKWVSDRGEFVDPDPLDNMVDGLSVRECLERYVAIQQADGNGPPMFTAFRNPLTPAQKEAASLAWSSDLKRKQGEARAKERGEVTVQDQWGDDD